MNKKNIKRAALTICSLMLLAAMPAYAQTSSKGDADTEPAVIVEVNTTPIPTAEPEIAPTAPPFTVPGNGEVLDDIPDGNKEFYTITTANNNTFYIVVDKASTSQNVYMLAKVNEDDVAEFIENKVTPTPAPTASVIIQQPTVPPIQTEVVPEQKNDMNSSMLIIGAVALAAIGGAFYFKVVKKPDDEMDDSEGMEYDDEEDQDE